MVLVTVILALATPRVPEEEYEIPTTAVDASVEGVVTPHLTILDEEEKKAIATRAENEAEVVKERGGDRAVVDHHHLRTIVGRGDDHMFHGFSL